MTKADTIVYVDDDQDDLELLSDVLINEKHSYLITLSAGSQLFPYMEIHIERLCLVLLDINLPGKSGFDLAEEIRATPLYGHLPIVLFSTATNSPQTARADLLGVEIIKKPSLVADWEAVASRLTDLCLHGQKKLR